MPRATVKGLGQKNDNSRKIESILAKKFARLDTVIWMFGSIDTKFSFYKKLCCQDSKIDPESQMIECATSYMTFVHQMHCKYTIPKGGQTIVLGAEPNGCPPCMVYKQCLKYLVIDESRTYKEIISKSSLDFHPDRLRPVFNSRIR